MGFSGDNIVEATHYADLAARTPCPWRSFGHKKKPPLRERGRL